MCVCFGRFWMHRASEISSTASAWRETQGTCPGHSVLPTEMDIGQGTNSRSANRGILSSSKPCHPKPRHLTGSRVSNSIKSSSHIIPSFWGHRSLFDANVECKPQQRKVEPFTISWALRRDWTKKHLLLLRQHFKGGIYRAADWTQLRPWEDVAGIRQEKSAEMINAAECLRKAALMDKQLLKAGNV